MDANWRYINQDNIREDLADPTITSNGDAMIGVLSPIANAIATTQHEVNSRSVSCFEFYSPEEKASVTARDGLLDITASEQKAVDAATVLSAIGKIGGIELWHPPGNYRLVGNLTVGKSGVKMVGAGSKNSVFLCESSGVSINYADATNIDISVGRFSMSRMSIRANSVAAKATGLGLHLTSVFDSLFEDLEFYEFANNLKLSKCYSNLFTAVHHFTSPLGVWIEGGANNCVGNTFIGGTFRLTSIKDEGNTTTFYGLDVEPCWDGTTNYFGQGSNAQQCYFEPNTTLAFPYIQLSDDCTFDKNIIAWSVSTRPDTFLVNVTGNNNSFKDNLTSYLDRVVKCASTSKNNTVEMDFQHIPVATAAEMYASYTVLDLGVNNKVTYVSRDGSQSSSDGLYANLTSHDGNRTWTNFCGAPAAHNLSNLTSAASTAVADPFGGSNVWLDTVSGSANGGFTYTPKAYESDGALYWTSSIYVYFPTGTTATAILVSSGGYGIGRYLSVSDLPKDKWIRLTQVSQPVVGEDIFPGFLLTGPVGATVYHSYHTLYEGQNPGVPTGNGILNQVSSKELSFGDTWASVAFSAGDYTSNAGTLTVASGDVLAYRYRRDGNTLFLSMRIDGAALTVATAAYFSIALPGGVVARHETDSTFFVKPAGGAWKAGLATIAAGGNALRVYADPDSTAGWAIGDNNFLGQIAIDIR